MQLQIEEAAVEESRVGEDAEVATHSLPSTAVAISQAAIGEVVAMVKNQNCADSGTNSVDDPKCSGVATFA